VMHSKKYTMFFSQQRGTQETKQRIKSLILLVEKDEILWQILTIFYTFHLFNYCVMTHVHVHYYIFQVLTPFVDKPFIFFHPQVWKNPSNLFQPTCLSKVFDLGHKMKSFPIIIK
jgi:hypothetical protein